LELLLFSLVLVLLEMRWNQTELAKKPKLLAKTLMRDCTNRKD
jgi:hypothetical protein